MAATAEPLLAKRSNRLVRDVAAEVGVMRADITKLRQALFNLLSNAAKFSENGTSTLRARREARAGRDWLVFAVADTGIGIAPDKIELVFEEFAQAQDHTTRQYGGTGLGLAITRRFCGMMGGRIDAESVVGEGSTFTIALPASVEIPEETAAKEDAVGDEPLSAAGPTAAHPILVIDDNADSRDVLRRTLEDAGHAVATAPDGEQGLALAREIGPSLILLDVMMPGMDGWSVLRELRGDPDLQAVPVAMVTVVDDERRMASGLGADEYLTKPVDRERLLAVARELAAGGRPTPGGTEQPDRA